MWLANNLTKMTDMRSNNLKRHEDKIAKITAHSFDDSTFIMSDKEAKKKRKKDKAKQH